MKSSIVVVGSCMTDLMSYTDNLPKPGETIHGSSFMIGFGGKGANQCVAAARMGIPTAMVGRVGKDSFGQNYIENFKNSKVNIDHVKALDGVSTGVASIAVDKNGENSIIIVAGANLEMSPKDVLDAEHLIRDSKVVICQGEIKEETTKQALKLARKYKVKSLMNAAPASQNLDEEIFALSDIFCVNETEAEILTGIRVSSVREAESACRSLVEKGCAEVILTLGAKGVVFMTSPNAPIHVSAPRVDSVVDTTGAGDSFVGALAYFLAARSDLSRTEMANRACQVASISIQTRGTQASFPFKEDLKDLWEA